MEFNPKNAIFAEGDNRQYAEEIDSGVYLYAKVTKENSVPVVSGRIISSDELEQYEASTGPIEQFEKGEGSVGEIILTAANRGVLDQYDPLEEAPEADVLVYTCPSEGSDFDVLVAAKRTEDGYSYEVSHAPRDMSQDMLEASVQSYEQDGLNVAQVNKEAMINVVVHEAEKAREVEVQKDNHLNIDDRYTVDEDMEVEELAF